MSEANLPAQAISILKPALSFLNFLCSFGGGSEMMRDGDTLGVLDALAKAQKYDCDIFSSPV